MKKTISLFALVNLLLLGFSSNVFTISNRNYEKKYVNEISNVKTMRELNVKRESNSNLDYIYSLSSLYVAQSRAASIDYVYTPRGTAVEVYIRDEMPSYYIEICNQDGDKLVPEAKRIAPSTAKYNCHSYAWHMQSTSNTYWMNNPSSYYTDWSYEESDGNIGDIICYFDVTGNNLHSGVIIGKTEGVSNGVCGDSNLFTVRSKWGSYGLYEHRGDQCPYTATYNGDASYVNCYKRHQHSYTYSQATLGHIATCIDCGYTISLSHVNDQHYCVDCGAYISTHDYDRNYEWVNYTMHNAECVCGAETTQGHAVSSGSFHNGQRYARCILCGGLAEKGFVLNAINSSLVTQITANGSFILPNGVIVLEDEDVEAYLNGTLAFYNKHEVSLIA